MKTKIDCYTCGKQFETEQTEPFELFELSCPECSKESSSINMNDLKKLKKIFSKQIKTYKKWKEKEDDSYIYDETYELFNDLSRGDCCDILDILSK